MWGLCPRSHPRTTSWGEAILYDIYGGAECWTARHVIDPDSNPAEVMGSNRVSSTRESKHDDAELTAGYFAEVDELRVRLASVAGCVVAVLVALAEPRIVIRREAARS